MKPFVGVLAAVSLACWTARAERTQDTDAADLPRAVGETIWFDSGDTNRGVCTPIGVQTINGVTPPAGLLDGWAHTQAGFMTCNGSNQVVEAPLADRITSLAATGTNGYFYDNQVVTTLSTQTAVGFVEHTRDLRIPAGLTLTVNRGGVMFNGIDHFIRTTDAGGVQGGDLTTGLPSGELFLIANGGMTNYRIYRVCIRNNGTTPLILVKGGPDRIALDGPNTFTGGVVINGGTLALVGDATGNRLAANCRVTVTPSAMRSSTWPT